MLCVRSRNGPLVVEPGVKAHRATQRSSSLGKTNPHFISVSIGLALRLHLVHLSCAVRSLQQRSLSLNIYRRSLYIPIVRTALYSHGYCLALRGTRGFFFFFLTENTRVTVRFGSRRLFSPRLPPSRLSPTCCVTILYRLLFLIPRGPQAALHPSPICGWIGGNRLI